MGCQVNKLFLEHKIQRLIQVACDSDVSYHVILSVPTACTGHQTTPSSTTTQYKINLCKSTVEVFYIK